MPRIERFTFFCNKEERRLIEQLAASLARSQSDAVRVVVIQAARQLEEQPITPHPAQVLEPAQV